MFQERPEITRRDFLKLASRIAGVMASSLFYGVSEAVIDFERAKQLATSEVEKRHKKKTQFIFGDHVPVNHPSTQEDFLVGEIAEWRLSTKPDENFEYLPEESRWIGGYEVGGRKRVQAFNEVVKSTKLVANTDGQLLIPDEYLPIMADETVKRLFSVLSLIVGGAVAGHFAIHKLGEKKEIDSHSRRQFLIHSLVTAIVGSLSYRTGMDLLHHNRGMAEISKLSDEWQEIFSVVPYIETAVPLRNKIMAANINALASLSLDEFVQNMTIFAGLAHVQVLLECIKSPENLQAELAKEMDEQLDDFFELYLKNSQSGVKQRFVVEYVGRGLGALYFPVFIRLNKMLEKSADELGITEAILQSISVTEKLFQFMETEMPYATASLLFLERLREFPNRHQHHDLDRRRMYTHEISEMLLTVWNTRQIRGIDTGRNFALLLPKTPNLPLQSISIGNVEFRHQMGFVNGFQRL